MRSSFERSHLPSKGLRAVSHCSAASPRAAPAQNRHRAGSPDAGRRRGSSRRNAARYRRHSPFRRPQPYVDLSSDHRNRVLAAASRELGLSAATSAVSTATWVAVAAVQTAAPCPHGRSHGTGRPRSGVIRPRPLRSPRLLIALDSLRRCAPGTRQASVRRSRPAGTAA
jgi:hypothetical protein